MNGKAGERIVARWVRVAPAWAVALAAALGTWERAQAQVLPTRERNAATVTDGEADAMRRQLQEQRRLREDELRREELVAWVVSRRRPPATIEAGAGAVCLENKMDSLRGVWTFEPATGEAGALRVPVCAPGEQWLTLPAGEWRVGFMFGTADGGRIGRLPPREVSVRPRDRYEIVLDETMERGLRERLGRRKLEPFEPVENAPRQTQRTAPPEGARPDVAPKETATPSAKARPTPAGRPAIVVEEEIRW
jgi:hypothetical protein